MVAELFSGALKRAIERDLSAIELLVIADKLNAAKEPHFVVTLYRSWIEHNADDPLVHAMYFNLGVVLSNANDLTGSRDALSAAIKLRPDFIPPYINLGFVLDRLGATGEAVTTWYEIVNKLHMISGEAVGHKTSAFKQIGRVLEAAHFDSRAEDALRQSLDIDPHQREVIQHWLSLRQRQCIWPIVTPWGVLGKKELLDGISPLSLAAYTDDPMLQLANSYHFAKIDVGQPKKVFIDSHRKILDGPRPKRLKIGYLSTDLREHAVGYLTAEIFDLHDREKVEIFAYYCGHKVDDPLHTRIKSAVEHWVDISEMSDEAAAQRIVDDGISILIDVNAYTHGARSKMLAMRPAPVIVNWLGFPGTTGSAYHQYIIADPFIIPPKLERYYSEKVVRIPCYQPTDRKRVVSDLASSRQEAGLPENATVFCCFNGAHKITPHTWKRWMTILHEVPGSVLWLLDGIETTNERLKELTVQHGIAVERLIFAKKMRNPDHLARYPLADLFLDTSPYGAHTTASDALWMGVPILTVAGRSFASRVCGSLATSSGLSDLVCKSADEYVARAIELGNNRPQLAAYRQRLLDGRDSCVLFNSPLLVSSLENLYEEMWGDFESGRLPKPDLTNLEIYGEIGAEIDDPEIELLVLTDYEEKYREHLDFKSKLNLVRYDSRLWPDPATYR